MTLSLVLLFGIPIVVALIYGVFFADGLPISQLFKRRFSSENQF